MKLGYYILFFITLMNAADNFEQEKGIYMSLLQNNMPMAQVGKKAPDFTAEAIINGVIKTISLHDFENMYKVIFFYPLDFTFVCPTELHAFQEIADEFEQRNVAVMGVSIDSVYSHHAWLKTPKNKGGIQGVAFPLISDIHKTISRSYGVLDEEQGIALRGVFVLDKDNVIQSAMINNLSLGRNIQEVLRVIDALQHVEKHGDVCPANWTEGNQTMDPSSQGLEHYFATIKTVHEESL